MTKPHWERAMPVGLYAMPIGLYDVVMDALAIGDAMVRAADTCGPAKDNAFSSAQRQLTLYMKNQWPDINWPREQCQQKYLHAPDFRCRNPATYAAVNGIKVCGIHKHLHGGGYQAPQSGKDCEY